MKTFEFPKYEIVKTTDGSMNPCWNVICAELGNSGYLYKEEQVEYWVGRNIKQYISKGDYEAALNSGKLVILATVESDIEDGKAHKAFMQDLEDLGYEDFDQVMQLLKTHRGDVLTLKEYEIWMEGYSATGERAPAALLGKAMGYSFRDAVTNHVQSLPLQSRSAFNLNLRKMNIWGCKLFDNETEARKAFG